MTSSISSQTPINQGWITPQEQLERLYLPILEKAQDKALVSAEFMIEESKEVQTSGVADAFIDGASDFLLPRIIESAIRSIQNPLPREGDGLSLSRWSLFDLCVERMVKLNPLLPKLTNWYIALRSLKALPDLVPPLPNDICEILDGTCPIFGDRLKEDGTPYAVADTHILVPITENLKNLNHFSQNILKPFGDTKYPAYLNPFRHPPFSDTYPEFGEIPFAPTHWGLMCLCLLPESRGKPWDEQKNMVNALNREDYEIPTLQQSYVALAIHKIATGIDGYLYDPRLARLKDEYLYIPGSGLRSRVKKMGKENFHFTVASVDHLGVDVLYLSDNRFRDPIPGISVIRKL